MMRGESIKEKRIDILDNWNFKNDAKVHRIHIFLFPSKGYRSFCFLIYFCTIFFNTKQTFVQVFLAYAGQETQAPVLPGHVLIQNLAFLLLPQPPLLLQLLLLLLFLPDQRLHICPIFPWPKAAKKFKSFSSTNATHLSPELVSCWWISKLVCGFSKYPVACWLKLLRFFLLCDVVLNPGKPNPYG